MKNHLQCSQCCRDTHSCPLCWDTEHCHHRDTLTQYTHLYLHGDNNNSPSCMRGCSDENVAIYRYTIAWRAIFSVASVADTLIAAHYVETLSILITGKLRLGTLIYIWRITVTIHCTVEGKGHKEPHSWLPWLYLAPNFQEAKLLWSGPFFVTRQFHVHSYIIMASYIGKLVQSRVCIDLV